MDDQRIYAQIARSTHPDGKILMPPPSDISRSLSTMKFPSPRVMEREPEVTKDTMHPTNNGSTEDVPPLVVPIVNHESISEPANAPVSASRP
ncbi:hypothetical protein Tco_1092092 [Tanacetum coccineum]|uniref:Uncharacterized protein n=1 Tax=Tanacetum coccineum TaxID=301880 RepID=A0ABQ5IA52_9ASTR